MPARRARLGRAMRRARSTTLSVAFPSSMCYTKIERQLIEGIDDAAVRELATRNRRWLRGQRQEAWAEFLAHLCVEPTEAAFGRNLWRVGSGARPWPEPRRTSRSATGSRFRRSAGPAGPRPPWTSASRSPVCRKGRGEGHCVASASSGGPSSPIRGLWAGDIAEQSPRADLRQVAARREHRGGHRRAEVVPFTNGAGKVEAWSKLRAGRRRAARHAGSGEAEPARSPSSGGRRQPNVAAVHKWELSVVPPDDLRTDDTEALATDRGIGLEEARRR